MAPKFNFGPRIGAFAKTPPEEDCRLNILEGSVRSGKTWGLHAKILWGCRYPVSGWKLLTGVSKETIYANVLNDLFAMVGPNRYSYNRMTGLLRIDKSFWKVMGAKDEGSDKFIQGMTVGYAVCDELARMPFDFFQMLRTRMSPAGARLYGSTNTDSPLHPLKTDILDNEELRRTKQLFSMHCTIDDNPNLSEDFKESLKAGYKGLFYLRYIKGLWVMAEDVIYKDCWNEKSTFTDAEMPAGLLYGGQTKQRIITVDYGTTNPMVFLDWRDDGQTFWGCNEYRWDSVKEMRQKTNAQYGDDMEKFLEGDRACQILVDPSAASFKTELTNRGFWVSDAENDVQLGIQKTSIALSKNVVRLHRDKCKPTIAEFEIYSWDKKKALRGLEEPAHEGSHGPDATRYLCCTKIPAWRLM